MKLSGVRTTRPRTTLTTASTDECAILDPRTSPSRVRTDLAAQEDRLALVRRLPLRQLHQGPHRSRVLDRGAEDCEEGHAGSGEEGEEIDASTDDEVEGVIRA